MPVISIYISEEEQAQMDSKRGNETCGSFAKRLIMQGMAGETAKKKTKKPKQAPELVMPMDTRTRNLYRVLLDMTVDNPRIRKGPDLAKARLRAFIASEKTFETRIKMLEALELVNMTDGWLVVVRKWKKE